MANKTVVNRKMVIRLAYEPVKAIDDGGVKRSFPSHSFDIHILLGQALATEPIGSTALVPKASSTFSQSRINDEELRSQLLRLDARK